MYYLIKSELEETIGVVKASDVAEVRKAHVKCIVHGAARFHHYALGVERNPDGTAPYEGEEMYLLNDGQLADFYWLRANNWKFYEQDDTVFAYNATEVLVS